MKNIIQVLDKDKRKRKRVELFSNLQVQLEILGVSSPAKIKDVSYSGFGLIVQPNANMAAIESLEAKLSVLNQDFKGTVANKVILPDQQIKIGIALPAQIQREIDFNTQDPSWDRVTDPETVRNIYQDLTFKGPEAPIEIKQQFSRAILHPLEMKDSGTMICEIIQIRQGVLEKGKAKCVFDLFQTCHAFDTSIDRIDNNKIEIKLSTTLARLLRRETLRVLKQKTNYELSVKLKSESIEKEISEFEIYDYSERGLSLLDPEGDLSLPRNLHFEEVVIEIKGIGSIAGKGQVRSYEWNRDQKSYIIGLLFIPGEEPNLTNWHNFILKARYPSLDFDYQEADHKKIWDLFARSGYTGLSTSGEFTHAFDVSKKTWRKLKDAGTKISKRILITSDKEVLGHLQMDRIYPDTWSAHQLAIDPSKSKLVGREIYSVTADVLKAESSKYFTSITDVNKPWNKRSYYDFIDQYPFPEHNEMKYYQVYEGKTHENYHCVTPQEYTVSIPLKWDLVFISKYFETHSSTLEVNACALNIVDLQLENLNRLYSIYGLERKRTFLILRKKDTIVGFARIEFGTEATNVFGLMDLLYIYVLDNFRDDSNLIHDILISNSLRFYKDNHRKDVIIYLNDTRKDYYVQKGLNYIWDGVRWIATIDIVSRYYAYVQNLYGHLILRREKIKKHERKI